MKHPYEALEDFQFWRREPGITDFRLFDPVTDVPFKLARTTKVITAGSCFAQHIADRLTRSGFNHYVTEKAHPMFAPAGLALQHNFGRFSARYGNLYTTRQLKQLIQRAYGEFEPVCSEWAAPDGRNVVDPFRPQIQPGGFVSPEELQADRRQHFRAVRQAFETADVFVFTLGLTEAWTDNRDGAVFPVAPGVAGGEFDAEIFGFNNFGVDEVSTDLCDAVTMLRARNAGLKIIFTVSPVPLVATYEHRHVFCSTTWSKSVLRVAAQTAADRFDNCCYFPSYEIITSPHVRGVYFDQDRREVTAPGVDHVMRLFFKHFASAADAPSAAPEKLSNGRTKKKRKRARREEAEAGARHTQEMARKLEILCDEEMLDKSPRTGGADKADAS
jgi:hypothetical protein